MNDMIVDISSVHKLYPRLESKKNDIVGAITDDILSCSNIPSQYQPNVIEILKTYNHLFADPKFVDDCCKRYQHPIAVRPFIVPGTSKIKFAAKSIISLLMALFVQAPSNKDVTNRFCADYRKLNSISKRDQYRMPTIEDITDKISAAQVFSTLDLKSGYWQCPLEKIHKKKQHSPLVRA
ncbi:Transposon Ty3-I Gag-Pol polyprotein [Thelohanellus kitauei]|uniref:Transposon Ty3-I Gag-Pol polyprotein n=1 Tax=Thelohanellus kitauei TaxID=669202 RepID=A0A0C2J8J0_THEKT|nr:Transposon Ty3-I Gag-Pol polyprotein [Thelohanellus kitauei]